MLEGRPKIQFLSILLLLGIGMEVELSFNRKLTGVMFYPYFTDGMTEHPGSKAYTVENVRTMLEVISTKFARILISEVDADPAPYKTNDSYYRSAGIVARTAEIAANINRERRNLSLTVAIGAVHWFSSTSFDPEFEIALEASQKAQSIYHGTVERILIWSFTSLDTIREIKRLTTDVTNLRKRSTHLNLPIGFKVNHCDQDLEKSVLRADSLEVWTLKRQLLAHSDFIICPVEAFRNESVAEKMGGFATFYSIQSQLYSQREGIKSIDNDIEVMWYTDWIKQAGERLRNNVTKHIRDLRDYWFLADQFATQNNYPLWFGNAIGDYGWWKLRRQDLINNPYGYVEYVSSLSDSFDDNAIENTALIHTSTHNPDNDANVSLSTEDTQENYTKTEIHGKTGETTATITTSTSNINVDSVRPLPIWINASMVIGAVLITAFLAGLVFFIYRKRSSSRLGILTSQEVNEFRHGISGNDYNETIDENLVNAAAFKQPYSRSLEISKSNLEIMTDQVLGGGEFGRVIKAFVRIDSDNAIEVALKMTKPNSGATAVKSFLSEIKILTFLGQHPNIVPIIGAYTAEIYQGVVYIATELCPLGSLRNCLKRYHGDTKVPDGSSVPLNEMIRWSYEITCGMEYLEGKRVIHADLATRNVLLSSESTAKITDFGLSRRMYEYTNYTKTSQEPLPWRWMAYESLKMMEFSPKSDVWSYGVTLWEIFSLGAQPYPGLTWTIDFVETLEEGLRLKKPKYATSEIYGIMEKCWSLGTEARPSFTELKTSMRDVQIKAIEDCYTSLSLT